MFLIANLLATSSASSLLLKLIKAQFVVGTGTIPLRPFPPLEGCDEKGKCGRMKAVKRSMVLCDDGTEVRYKEVMVSSDGGARPDDEATEESMRRATGSFVPWTEEKVSKINKKRGEYTHSDPVCSALLAHSHPPLASHAYTDKHHLSYNFLSHKNYTNVVYFYDSTDHS